MIFQKYKNIILSIVHTPYDLECLHPLIERQYFCKWYLQTWTMKFKTSYTDEL
jgi:hypothetical protein